MRPSKPEGTEKNECRENAAIFPLQQPKMSQEADASLAAQQARLRADLIKVERLTFDLGVAHVREVAERMDFPIAKVRHLWSLSPGFCWLDREAQYGLQRTQQHNRLLRHIDKILAVAPVCSLSEMHNGLSKTTLFKRRMLPIPILEAFCREMGLTVTKADVSSEVPVRPEEVLPSVEYGLYTVLQENGGLAHHSHFEEYFKGKGVASNVFAPTMTRSPILLKLEHRIWRRIGLRPDASRITELKELIGPIAPPCDVSDRVEIVGNEVVIWIPVSPRSREKGCGHIPQQWQEKLRGRYTLYHDGVALAEIHAIGPEVIGLQKLHRMVGSEAQSIKIGFDRDTWKARMVE